MTNSGLCNTWAGEGKPVLVSINVDSIPASLTDQSYQGESVIVTLSSVVDCAKGMAILSQILRIKPLYYYFM